QVSGIHGPVTVGAARRLLRANSHGKPGKNHRSEHQAKAHGKFLRADYTYGLEERPAGGVMMISRTSTVILAAILGTAATASAQTPPTFYKDVLPILQNNCQTCHRPGEVAPMS